MITGRYIRGMTLLELLMTLAIIGVLLAIAFPNYTQYSQTDSATRAKMFLLEVSDRQQHYLRRHGTYAQSLQALGLAVDSQLARHYEVTVEADNNVGNIGYRLSALPKTSATGNPSEALTINHLGRTSDNWNP